MFQTHSPIQVRSIFYLLFDSWFKLLLKHTLMRKGEASITTRPPLLQKTAQRTEGKREKTRHMLSAQSISHYMIVRRSLLVDTITKLYHALFIAAARVEIEHREEEPKLNDPHRPVTTTADNAGNLHTASLLWPPLIQIQKILITQSI